MKKQPLLLFFIAALFVAFTTTSCSKKDDTKKDDTENPGDGDGEEPADLSPYLKGSNYYLITLDETSAGHIKSKIVKDYRPGEGPDGTSVIDIWPGGETYSAGSASGPNAFGEVEGWLSLVVTGFQGWSGGGVNHTAAPFLDLSGVKDDYTFHIAMKSKDNATHRLIFYPTDGDGKEVAISIGSKPYGDETTQPVADFARDGEWHHIEIPAKTLFDLGLRYTAATKAGYVFGFQSGGVEGTTFDIDGVFFYKKAK